MSTDVSAVGPLRGERTPFVGRDDEHQALIAAAKAVMGGETRIVSIIGPAGTGKTRLVQDAIVRPVGAPSGLRVYTGTCRDSATAFGMLGKLLRARFGITEGTDKESARAHIRREVASVLDARMVDDVVYFLGQLLGVPTPESPLLQALGDEPQEAGIIRRAVFKAFLEGDASSSPICLILEDLHEAHDDTLVLLRYLLEYLTGPILIICLARPELLTRHEDWARAGERRHRVIDLEPLADAEAALLMRHLLAHCEGGPPTSLVDAACAYAAGNPLLLEQMVRIYRDKGVLVEIPGARGDVRFHVALERLSAVQLPLTIDDAVDVRLAVLSPKELQLLEQAAAMGTVSWSGAFVSLSRMGREAPDLWGAAPATDVASIQTSLAGLVERDYLLRLPDSTFPGSVEFVFKHNGEREAVVERTRPTTLRRYHQGIADWMHHQEALRESAENVAMQASHHEKAGNAFFAGLSYLEAADVARARYAYLRACDYYEKGLDLLGETYTGRRIDALHHYGDVLQILGRIDDALAAFRDMLTLAYRLDLKRKGGAAHNRIGRLYRETGALEEAAQHLTTGMALFETDGDERGVTSSIDDIGKLHWLKGEYKEALETLRNGLDRRRRLGDLRSIALSLDNLGLVLQDSGEFPEAVETFGQSLQIRREIGDLLGVVTTLTNLGAIARDQGRVEDALQMFAEALDVARRIGDRNRMALVLTNLGVVHYRTQKFEHAIVVLKQAEDLCDELGDKLGLAEALRGLGKAYMLHGDLAKARECISRAVDLFASTRDKVRLGIALRTLGEITAAGGWGPLHTRNAREYFNRSAAIFEKIGNMVELARTQKAYARFLLSSASASDDGVRDRAIAMNADADAVFTRFGITTTPVQELDGTQRH